MTIAADRRAEALRLVRRGLSVNDAARRTGIARKTLTRWLRAEPPEDTPPAPSDEPPTVDALQASATQISRTIAERSLRMAEIAEQTGNASAATRALKTGRDAANDLARAERATREQDDGFFISREDYAAAERSIRDRVARLAADLERTGGLVCGACGRSIRIKLAKGAG